MSAADDDFPETVRAVGLNANGHTVVERTHDDGSVRRGIAFTPEEGKPLAPGCEVLACKPDPTNPANMRARVAFKMPGPPQVASPAYRDGWDRVFAKRDLN